MQVGAPLLMKSYNDELEFFFGDAHIPPPQSNQPLIGQESVKTHTVTG